MLLLGMLLLLRGCVDVGVDAVADDVGGDIQVNDVDLLFLWLVLFFADVDAVVGDVVEGDVADDVSGLVVNVHFMTIKHTRRCLNAH